MDKERYEAKRQARIDRLRYKSQKAKEKAENHKKTSDDLVSYIPFGQPILVGHHSEKAHRNRLERSQNHVFKWVEESGRAADLKQQAISAEKNTSIYDDDPEAIDKLVRKLFKLQKMQEQMKAINKAWRKYDKTNDDSELKNLGYDDQKIIVLKNEIEKSYSWEKQPYPKWMMSNNNASINSVKKRLDYLDRKSKEVHKETIVDDVKVIENVDENRLQLFFPGKPSDKTRTELKSNGFRWSKYYGCWQRQLNNGARWAGERALKIWKEHK
jgi:hypothetical protein